MKKKSFYILALAALAVSCTNDELTTNETNAVVGFHALTSGVTTRAVNEPIVLTLKTVRLMSMLSQRLMANCS